ncbi:MAG: zinc ABC transporter substrate-binding protein, partial [Candidatus Cloacimonetes bacterium]|nr:zinc ABC transporter substrate-binding protein [Candidatus Cloacimonadota bacterium]
QIPVEIEGKTPTAKELSRIIDFAKNKNIKVIFVQSQFSTTEAEAIAESIDGKVIQIDPLAEDYLNNLKHIVDVMVKEL